LAKVTQKVDIDPSEYIKNLRKMAEFTKEELARVDSEFNETGNAVDDFAEKTKKGAAGAQGALKNLAKGFIGSIGKLSVAGLGALAGGAAAKEFKEGLDFTSVINQVGTRQGLTDFQRGEFRNQLLDISSRRDVEEEDVAAAADVASQFGAATDEAVKFADVIATASKTAEGLDAGQLARDVAEDIRGR